MMYLVNQTGFFDDFVVISIGPALSPLFTIFTAKDCKCKCDDKENMDPKCISGKWDDKEQKMIVSNSCKWSCWKCRMEDSFKGHPMSYCSQQPC